MGRRWGPKGLFFLFTAASGLLPALGWQHSIQFLRNPSGYSKTSTCGGLRSVGLHGRSLPSLASLRLGRRTCSPLPCGVSLSMKTDDSSVPVTLLGGFLGSGKTTILKHILENQVGLKVGVIVNDVASVNIDAKLVRGVTSSSVPGGSDTIELQNGCACCSISDELFSAVEKLVETGRARGNQFDHILVELSGVAEPSIVKSNFERGKAAGLKSALDARIKQIVTVVDSSEFVQQWMSEERLGEVSRLAPEVGQDCAAARAVSEFLAEQIEAADVVVLNKVDMVDSSTVKTTARIVDGLLHEKKHKLIETSWGKIPIQSLFSEDAEVEQVAHEAKHEHEGHSHDEACHDPHCQDQSHEHHHAHSHDEHCDDPHCTDQAHGHSHSHEQQKTTAEEKIGISSFVYRARRPFDTDRLFKLVKSWPIPRKDAETYLYKLLNDREFIKGKEETSDGRVLQPVFRSKGFIWLDSMPTRIRYWSHVGRYFALEDAGKWWADTEEKLLEAVKVASPSDYEAIMKDDWEGEFGDRRQELVFIGAGMKEEAIRKALDRCLLTEEEMVKFRQELEQVIEAESNPRFKVGDKVVCQCGTWLPGVVIKIGYREPDWPITKPDAPYQVKLEDGTLIYVPFDEDDFIRPRKG